MFVFRCRVQLFPEALQGTMPLEGLGGVQLGCFSAKFIVTVKVWSRPLTSFVARPQASCVGLKWCWGHTATPESVHFGHFGILPAQNAPPLLSMSVWLRTSALLLLYCGAFSSPTSHQIGMTQAELLRTAPAQRQVAASTSESGEVHGVL